MALTLLASNNASSVLSAGISASATTLTVNTGTGVLFPTPVSGTSYFKLTLVDAATGTLTEIVHVTAVSGDTFTIVRAQEGTTARLWSANDIAANMLTAGTFAALLQINNNLSEIYAAGSAAQLAARNNLGLAALLTGRLLGPPQIFTSSGTYTPTAGTTTVIIEVQGAGGGGAGAGFTSSSNVSMGSGGSAGGYGKTRLPIASATGQVVTVGVGGTAGNIAPTAGGAGGTSSFGSLVVALGGNGGNTQPQTTPPFTCTGVTGGSCTGGNLLNETGNSSGHGISINVTSNYIGQAGSSPLGTGGFGPANNNVRGGVPSGYGAGGGAGISQNSASAGQAGQNGSNGVIIIWEYA